MKLKTSIMKKRTSDLRFILGTLKEIIIIDHEEQVRDGINGDWDGTVTYTAIKRILYGLWHDGENEFGEDMVMHMSYNARKFYRQLINQVFNKRIQEPVIRLPKN